MSPTRLPLVKKIIRQVTQREARALARRVLASRSVEQIHQLVPRLHRVL